MRRPIPKMASETLRRKAAEVARENREETASSSASDLESIVQELRIHQIELELQNEELQEARQHAEELQGRGPEGVQGELYKLNLNILIIPIP